jgi:tyrosyl-tRNA synthetase
VTHFLDELAWRGLLYQTTAEEPLWEHLRAPGRIAYAGFDPTSDSLHVGNLVPIQLLRLWQRAGHTPIILMGGGTGLIGDPSGRDTERQLLSREQVQANIEGQRRIFEALFDFDPASPNAAVIVNNMDWLERLGYIEILRDVGKHFSINMMIQKESVKQRLESREQGISYTELSYMILQAYDFLHLRREMGCTVQMAGSDQFGNIVAGIDLIRRKLGHEDEQPYGVTAPLLTRADGKKMGKTAQGAVWMTADRTSPYQLYQYWINTDDADVANYLRWFTLRDQETIEDVLARHEAAPHERLAQRALAAELTGLLHGEEALGSVQVASEALFTGDVGGLDAGMLDEVFADVPRTTHDRAKLAGEGVPLAHLLPETTLARSRREAREFLAGGAVTVNGQRIAEDRPLTTTDLLHGHTILLRRGKKTWHATRWE